MVQSAQRIVATEDEYLAHELRAETRSELVNGEIVAMAGGSPKHNAIAANLVRAIGNRLEGRRCVVFGSDQRVHVPATGLYTYPDVTIACGALQFHPKDKNTLVNPRIVVEVLSDSTEAYDRGAKSAHYRSSTSLEEYVLVSQNERRVEHYRRVELHRWLLTEAEGEGAVLALPGLGCEVPLAEIYRDLDLFDEEPAAASDG